MYGHSISNELQKKMKVFIPKPEYTEYVQLQHKFFVELLNLQSTVLSDGREEKRDMMVQSVEDGNNPEAPINMEILENDMH